MNGRNTTFRLVALLGLLLAFEAGCAKQSNEIPVGVYGSLTGTTATFGISSKQGIELFMDNVNQAGGVAGTKLHMTVGAALKINPFM